MALRMHELGLRLAKHIGVTAFDPGDASNLNPLSQAAARTGDLEEIVACINGALQEMWLLAPHGVRALYPNGCPAVSMADMGAVEPEDSTAQLLLPTGWEESVLLPLALRRLSAHPEFQPESARAEIERQAAIALRVLMGLDGERPTPARLSTQFH